MMAKQDIHNWQPTVAGLHKGALLLGAVQRLTQEPLPAYLELGLEPTATGLLGSELPRGERIELDFAAGSLAIKGKQGQEEKFSLQGATQAQVFEALFGVLSTSYLAGMLPAGRTLFERVSTRIAGRGGRYKAPQKNQLIDETLIEINAQAASEYLAALKNTFDGLARFRAHLMGLMTPLVVWPEHFDLSMLWFTGTEIDENQPHLNFGFAPYSPGLEFPYLYAYAYPYPDRYQPPELPEGARWHTAGWTGVVLPYEALADDPRPAERIESDMRKVYHGLRALLPG
jgi:hypothetical protein